MEKKNVLKNQKGFTLVEIIAVLVILGILAAVAVPKFVDLQQEARNKAVDGAIAALNSQAVMDFSEYLLANDGDTNWSAAESSLPLGDFEGGYSATTAGLVTTTITSGPGWFGNVPATETSDTFSYK